MAGDELMGRIAVVMLAPTLCQHVLLIRLQHGEVADFLEVTVQAVFAGQCGQFLRSHSDPWSLGERTVHRAAVVRQLS